MLPNEIMAVSLGITVIQFVSTLIIVGHVIVALGDLLSFPGSQGWQRARNRVAEGVLLGLSLVVAATLLRTIVVRSFSDLGVFFVVFALRTILKRVFTWEAQGG
jgi:uncharacterized membrane protein